MTNTLTAELTRPIVGIENRTAQEVFDIMSDRIKRADLFAENAKNSTLPSPPVSGEAVAWLRDAHNGEGDECLVPCAKGDHGGFPVYASPITNEPVGVTEEYDRALREASDLATWLWKTYYKDDAPNWGLCDTAAGIITQIDNMVAGLEKKPVSAQGITISREDFEDAIGFMRPLVAKWRHDDAGKSLGELFDRLSAAIGERG